MSARGTIVALLNDLCLHSRKMAGWAGANWSVADVGPDRIVIAAEGRRVPMTERRLVNVGQTIANKVGPLPFERLVCGAITVPAPPPPIPTNPFEPAATMLARLMDRANAEGWVEHITRPHDALLTTMSRWAGDRATHVTVVDADPGLVQMQVTPESGAHGGVRDHADAPAFRVAAMLDFLVPTPSIRVAVFDRTLHGWIVWDWDRIDTAAPEGTVAWLQQEHRRRVFGDLWRACEDDGWTRGERATSLPESVL